MSLKRHLSPAPLPTPKRFRDSSIPEQRLGLRNGLSFDDSLYDELILCIFSHLSWVDLCTAQPTNKKWCRLTADNELWRNLYLITFGRPRLRGARGHLARSDGREVRPLPGRAAGSYILKDWKWMFRISSNWRKGRCGIERLDPATPLATPEPKIPYLIHIHLAGHLTIVASSCPSLRPTIDIFTSKGAKYTLHCDSQASNNFCQITTMAIDQAPPPVGNIRLVSFLSTGEFIIFLVNPLYPPTSPEILRRAQRQGNTRTLSVLQAVYHHPLLITLSATFSISLYDVSGDIAQHKQTLTSFTSFPPTSMVLSTPAPAMYKLVIIYAAPVYPSHWSIGATELVISGPTRDVSVNISGFLPAPSQASVGQMKVTSTRTVRAFDVPQGWIDDAKITAIREQWNRKVPRVADTQTDGKWVVVAPGENIHFSSTTPPGPNQYVNSMTTLQLYRLHLPAANSVASPPPRLTFVRNLYGQMGPIASLALSDGRCVSLGLNGSLWVWDLEAGTGAEVSSTSTFEYYRDGEPARGVVTFDDRRIVTSKANQIIVHRFDI
ncbi:hypothetical protein BDZ94DRAFT_1243664 [Collybia nuda]|uniref:F-box domain-containing protein n=1 Tax=Collybia nuda TaxID=64659 RepID=A0A9P6CKG8_9AGAR|nr:hypothetical protein BDZ94DRAFT_1243664 [Collybia nuda]